MTGTKLPIKHK